MACHSKQKTGTGAGDSALPPRTGSLAWFCVVLIRAYRYCISPLFPPTCRFVPTCSQYAVDACMRYGAIRGIYLTFCRVIRCHPFSRGGYDPVK